MACRLSALCLIFILNTFSAVHAGREIPLTVSLLRGQAYQKVAGDRLFSISVGKIDITEGTTILTGLSGIVFLQPEPGVEFRLREESAFGIIASNSFELRKGIAGLRVSSSPVELSTPHLRLTLQNTLAVIKVNPMLTRVCVIKGGLQFWQGRSTEKLLLQTGHEIAAAQGQVSRAYQFSDELRYTWYWTTPDREPSLQ
ncbi:MAG: hypothetical protein PHD82_15555 [Candidatus Riflebacteria bacterium]|nr:hypothetical protein [Candidatus Riflebacteria bacterium]